MVENLPPLFADANGFSLPLIAAGGLAVIGWVLAAPGRMLAAVALLVALGAVAGAAVYVLNGLSVFDAFMADPVGGAIWFAWVGAQLAVPGVVLAYIRLWTGSWSKA